MNEARARVWRDRNGRACWWWGVTSPAGVLASGDAPSWAAACDQVRDVFAELMPEPPAVTPPVPRASWLTWRPPAPWRAG